MNELTDQDAVVNDSTSVAEVFESEVLKAVYELYEGLVALDQVRAAQYSKSESEIHKLIIVDYDLYERDQSAIALDHVIKFLMRVLPFDGSLSPIIKLRNALGDLNRGVTVPMLRPRRHSGSDPTGQIAVKGAAAVTMSRLMKTGLVRKEAAQRVADYLRRGGMLFGDRRSTEGWRTVAAWRDRAVKATKSKDHLLGEYYKYWSAEIIMPPTSAQEYERYRKGILETLLSITRCYNDIYKDSN
jgi:hypothetical protein